MKYRTVGLLILVSSSVLMAQDTTTQNKADAIAAIAELKASHPASRKLTNRTEDFSTRAIVSGSSFSSVVATDVTVAANSFKIIDQTQIPFDFTGAENLSVSVISPTSLNSVFIGVSWAPYLANFILTNLIDGSTFKAGSSGGAQVPVFGPNLILVILNNGTTAITIHQLAVYAYVH